MGNKGCYVTNQSPKDKLVKKGKLLRSISFSISYLTIMLNSLRHNFRSVQIQSICRRQNKCNLKTEIIFWDGLKTLQEKEKMLISIFSFSHNCFQKASFSGSLKVRIVW